MLETAVLLIQCPDRKGIVARITGFLFEHAANIIQADQHSTDPAQGMFFMRIAFCMEGGPDTRSSLEKDFAAIAAELQASYQLRYASEKLRMGILVSKYDHCLVDILYRWKTGELPAEIPFIISNHPDVQPLAARYDVPFFHIPVHPDSKAEAEKEILKLLHGRTDFLVLARYMQIISGDFLKTYQKDIINIHHSFLPSFKGANPYKQAYERGVKVIGATAHYVTEDLDEGPIICQAVDRVSHRDGIEDLQRKGRNLEKMALSDALLAHLQYRVIRHQNRTIVFS
jgi:formyltetrahydrofolate deformylase